MTIKIDGQHDVMTADKAPAYSVPPCSVILLDGANFHAPSPNSDGETQPTVVHVARGEQEYYRARWTPSGEVSLSAATLEPVRGGVFRDFSPGPPYVVAIGTERSSSEKVSFAPMWVGSIQVQER